MILKNTKFKYAQAREKILDAILSGNLAPDSVLPSEQQLCAQLGVGRITLRAALHELEVTGIIIKQHGRQSRVNLDALKGKQTPFRRIAWVDTSPIQQTNPIYFDIFRFVSEQSAIRNVKLDYISLFIDAMAENFFRRQNEYDGLILGEFTSKYWNYLSEITHKNVVCVDCPRPGIPHCVKTDCYLGGQLAARALIESGHKKPIILRFGKNTRDYPPFEERFNGFYDFLQQFHIPLPQEQILNVSSWEEDHFVEFLKKNLEILHQADSLFVMADSFAVSALYALPDLGVKIPTNLSLIGFDGLTLSRFVSPVLSTIRQPVQKIGEKALEMVLNPSESSSYPEIILIPPLLEVGATLLSREKKCSVFNKIKTIQSRKERKNDGKKKCNGI